MTHYKTLSRNIFIALILGALVGGFLPNIAHWFSFLGIIFKLSLAMIVMPIILTSIISGLESIGDVSKLSSLGLKSIGYFLSTSFIAIFVGLTIVSIVEPGIKKPKSEIIEIIDSTNAHSTEILTARLIENLAQELELDKSSAAYLDLKTSLTRFSASSDSLHHVKEQTTKFMGSFAIRSKLSQEKKPKPIEQMSVNQFLIAQIQKSLVNPFEALAKKNVLAVILFALLLGGAMTTIGPLGKNFFHINRAVNLATNKIVALIMRFAPLGVFGLISEVIASTGTQMFSQLGLYALCVICGLLIHAFLVLPLIQTFISKRNPREFFSAMRPAMTVAFSTSSSSATLPITMDCVENNLKVDKRVSGFVLPLGSTINMDGTALYEAIAAMFLAQLYGISLGLESQVIVALTAALASIGAAGIPAAGTVTMALVLSAVGIPMEGIGLLLAVDRPLDMARTAVNIASDATGCTVIEKISQKELGASLDTDQQIINIGEQERIL